MRVKLIVSYDGTDYCGWQVQPNGVTVEEKLNEAATQLFGVPIKVVGASRTDAGVHALGNVCVFDVDTQMPAGKISYALNQRLPEDIAVQDSCEVPADFHPRYAKCKKTYEYRILNRRFPLPTRRRDTYFYHYPLDEKLMDEAAKYFIGEHDFLSFCAVGAQVKSTVRNVLECGVTREDEIITLRITGEGFLYNMVRIIAGTLIQVGAGQRKPDEIPAIIEALDRSAAGPTAPAHGLTLIGIEYY